jgi:hypothetical protein
MYTYYPAVLLTLSAMVLFCPLPILYWRARIWFLDACVRRDSFQLDNILTGLVATFIFRTFSGRI